MKIGVATAFACGVGVWKRLADEGHDVLVWRGSEKADSPVLLHSHRKVGEGIVPLTDSWYFLKAWVKEAADKGEPALMVFDSSGLGKFADDARKAGIHVIGGGSFCDRLEKDRGFGSNVAEDAGILIPRFKEFKSLEATLDFAKAGGVVKPVYWKTDVYIDGDATHLCKTSEELVEYLTWIRTRSRNEIYNVLEEKVDGIALSTGRWWNGRAWVGPYEWTFERKKFMAGDVGPSTGCSLNAVGFYPDEHPAVAEALHWDALTPLFLKRDAPPGLYDINAVVSEGKARFLEWTPRFGWDSEGTSLTALYDDLGAWLWYVATGQGSVAGPSTSDFAISVRLSVPPAPWEHGERDERGSCVGLPVRGEVGDLWSEGFVGYQLMRDDEGLCLAAPEGLVGLAESRCGALSEGWRDCEEVIENLRVPGLQYRVDVEDALREDAEECAEEGFPTHAGLLL